jgi:hypothetical protein
LRDNLVMHMLLIVRDQLLQLVFAHASSRHQIGFGQRGRATEKRA